MRKKQEKQLSEVLEMIRHDLKMRDFELVPEEELTNPLRFHIVAMAGDMDDQDIPGYISVDATVRQGLYACSCEVDDCLRAAQEGRVCTLSEQELQDFLDIVEESLGGKVSTYEVCDDGLAYRVSPPGSAVILPEFIAVEEVLFAEHSLSAITPFADVLDIIRRWPEIRDRYVQPEGEDAWNAASDAGRYGSPLHGGAYPFPMTPKKNLPS